MDIVTTRPKRPKSRFCENLKQIYGIGATIRIGQEIQCLPYAEFFLLCFMNPNIAAKVLWYSHWPNNLYLRQCIQENHEKKVEMKI